MVWRIELNLGNQSAHANSVKPFYKGWALLILLILQNKVFYVWVISHLVFNNILHFFIYNVYIGFYLFIILLLILASLFLFIGLYRLDSLSNASFLVTRFFLEFFTDVNKELNKNKIKKLIINSDIYDEKHEN